MDSPLTSFSISYSIEPPALHIPLLNDIANIWRSPSTCVTLETKINKGGRASVKKLIFRRFCHWQFLYAVGRRWTHWCYHLVMVTLVSTLQSKWHLKCLMVPMEASPKLSRSERGLGSLTNIQRVSAARQSTAGRWAAIDRAFEHSWAGTYDALAKTYFKLNNYLTNTMNKRPPVSGTLFFTDAFTKKY